MISSVKYDEHLNGRKMRAIQFTESLAGGNKLLFVHWKQGITQAFV